MLHRYPVLLLFSLGLGGVAAGLALLVAGQFALALATYALTVLAVALTILGMVARQSRQRGKQGVSPPRD